MTRLLLVRHAETGGNAERLIQGQHDHPLSERGREQALLLRHRLARETLHAAYSSDLGRAADTAQLALGQRDVALSLDPALREMDFGEWDGRSQAELRREVPELVAQRRQDPMSFVPPGGEPFRDVVQRCTRFLEQTVQRHSDESVLLVSHGGPLSIILYRLLDIPPTYPWRFRFGNASLSIVEVLPLRSGLGYDSAEAGDDSKQTTRSSLMLFNDTCHWSMAEAGQRAAARRPP